MTSCEKRLRYTRRKMSAVAVSAAVGACIAAALPPPVARAETSAAVEGEVLQIFAAEEAGVVDKELAKIPALKRMPFKAFGTMRVLERKRVALRKGQVAALTLKNGRRLALTSRGKSGTRHAFKIHLSSDNNSKGKGLGKGVTVEAKAQSGEYVFLAGHSVTAPAERADSKEQQRSRKKGTLILGIRVMSDAKQ